MSIPIVMVKLLMTDTKLRDLLNDYKNITLGEWSEPPQCMPDDVGRQKALSRRIINTTENTKHHLQCGQADPCPTSCNNNYKFYYESID